MKYFTVALLAAMVVIATAAPSCDSEKGEVFMECGTACPDTCDNYDTIRPCTLQCVVGCFCPRGTVRRESDGTCVKPEQC